MKRSATGFPPAKRRVAVGALVAASLLLAACGRSSNQASDRDPGITDTTIKIGSSLPLSGGLAAAGQATQAAIGAYFASVNKDGGVKMGDGHTRKIKFVAYDDGYDPAKAVQNYQRLVSQDKVFALFSTFGTAPNLAIGKLANKDKIPQAYVHAGDAILNDRTKTPWTSGSYPTYESEGEAYAKYLVSQNKPLTVAVLRQNDTLGTAYLDGLKKGIDGSQVKIVKTTTYVPSDSTVDSQISALAQTKADVLYMAVALPGLMIGGIQHAKTLGWDPQTFLVSITSDIDLVIKNGGLTGLTKMYSDTYIKAADDPQWQDDPAVKKYLERTKSFPKAKGDGFNAEVAYMQAEMFVSALQQTKKPTRQAFRDALDSNNDTKAVDVLLPGVTFDASRSKTEPPIHGLVVTHYEGGSWKKVADCVGC